MHDAVECIGKLVVVGSVWNVISIPIVLIIGSLEDDGAGAGFYEKSTFCAIFYAFDDEDVVIAIAVRGEYVGNFDADRLDVFDFVMVGKNWVFDMGCRGSRGAVSLGGGCGARFRCVVSGRSDFLRVAGCGRLLWCRGRNAGRLWMGGSLYYGSILREW